jgi:hypothetical protein
MATARKYANPSAGGMLGSVVVAIAMTSTTLTATAGTTSTTTLESHRLGRHHANRDNATESISRW